jgi:hypothetical protein
VLGGEEEEECRLSLLSREEEESFWLCDGVLWAVVCLQLGYHSRVARTLDLWQHVAEWTSEEGTNISIPRVEEEESV